jgi:uncharacterized protein YoxC
VIGGPNLPLHVIALIGNDATAAAEVTGVPLAWLIGFFFVSATIVAFAALLVGMELGKGEQKAENEINTRATSTLDEVHNRFEAAQQQLWSEDRLRVYLAGMVELQRSVPPLVRSAQPRARSFAAFLVAGIAAIALAVFAVVLAVQLPRVEQGASTDDPSTEVTTDQNPTTTEETTDQNPTTTEETTDQNPTTTEE